MSCRLLGFVRPLAGNGTGLGEGREFGELQFSLKVKIISISAGEHLGFSPPFAKPLLGDVLS